MHLGSLEVHTDITLYNCKIKIQLKKIRFHFFGSVKKTKLAFVFVLYFENKNHFHVFPSPRPNFFALIIFQKMGGEGGPCLFIYFSPVE